MTTRDSRSSARAMAIAFAAITAGCGGVEDGDETVFGDSSQPLLYSTQGLWPQRDIPVCWTTTGQDLERRWVRDALRGQRSWSQHGNLNFVGWGACGPNATGIRLTGGAANVAFNLGQSGGTVAVTLDFSASPETLYTRCSTNNLNREQCIKATAIHEFGHAIGYAHEHNRSERTTDCTSQPQGGNGDATFGPFDIRSITAYCNFTTDLSTLDRRGTDRLYRQAYGAPRRLHDYNGDWRDDVLCHDVNSGDKWLDFADGAGRLEGTDWERYAPWCNHDTGRLFQGDFNGDGRDDLLCHDIASGHKWIDDADSSGRFGGTDWELAANWCGFGGARMYVGDFNGDHRDDLLCHDPTSGVLRIDYANGAGRFGWSDWEFAAGLCMGATDRLVVGDFNGDLLADLLCHDVASGHTRIDYADSYGRFYGIDWQRFAPWCNHDSGELLVGDFNGDWRDDLLCHDGNSGYLWIDYADGAGRLTGTNWQRSAGYCNRNAARLFIGDLNGDGRDDLLCHDVSDGYKWVDYADGDGRFFGFDWDINSRWCGHAAGELH